MKTTYENKYYTSTYGRLNYLVCLIVFLLFTPIPWAFLGMLNVIYDNWLFLVFSIAASFYCLNILYRLISKSARFVITKDYLQVNSLLRQKKYSWHKIDSFPRTMRLHYTNEFMFLSSNGKATICVDVTGITPNYETLEADIRKHIMQTHYDETLEADIRKQILQDAGDSFTHQ